MESAFEEEKATGKTPGGRGIHKADASIVFDVDDYYGDGFSPGVSGVWDLKNGEKGEKVYG